MAEPRVAVPVGAAGDGGGPRGRRGRWPALLSRVVGSRVVRWGFVAAAVALAGYALARDWTGIRHALAQLGFWPVVGALGAVLLTYAVAVEPFRLLLRSLGSPLPYSAAAKVVFIGQLGKYLPGKVSSLVASMELGRAYQVPRSRSASALVLQLLVGVVTALIAAVVTLPFVRGSLPSWWAVLAVPVVLALLYPRVLNGIISLLLRVARQPPLEKPLTVSALVRPMAWFMVSWLLYGLQIWILAVTLGSPPGKTALVAVGGFAVAWAAGFVIVFVPAGVGVRDFLLLGVLTPLWPAHSGDALVVVLASRLITTVADLACAGLAARFVRRPPDSAPAADGQAAGSRSVGQRGA
ncbi:MAG: flippase-like domain-containing protein [Actinobacteria bacterium]|nr:flippase-like domain-containing protein [Actinomycetota bacterium]